MGTQLIENPQLNLFTGAQEKPLKKWFDDGLTVKERMMQPRYFEGLMELLEKRGCYPQYFDKLVEPGYGHEGGVLLGNWNNASPNYGEAMRNWLEEKLDIFLGFDDEYHYCSYCYGVLRTSADSYGWTPHYLTTECEITCLDCIEDNWSDWGEDLIEDYKEVADGHPGNPPRAFPRSLIHRLTDMGFLCLDDEDSEACARFESGWHPGQTDDPTEILMNLHKTFPDCEVIFVINSVGQFDMAFSVWIRYKTEEN